MKNFRMPQISSLIKQIITYSDRRNKMKKNLLNCIFLAAAFVYFGCGSAGVRYVMDEPAFSDVTVRGLNEGDKIIEVSDAYKGKINDENTFWCVIERDGNYQLGKLNIATGEIKDLNPMAEDEYGEHKSIYWDSFNEENLGGGEACMGSLLAATPCGGTISKYGLNAQKRMWGDPDNTIKVSYQYEAKQSTSSNYTTTSWQSAGTQTFSRGDKVVTINVFDGYGSAYNLQTGKYARFYPIDENNYLGFQAEKIRDADMVNVFAYILNFNDEAANQKSFGAGLERLPGTYIDGCATKDGKTACLILRDVNSGNYIIKKGPTKEYIKNVKMLRAIQ